MIVVSIIGTDRLTADYGAAKIAHGQAMLSGPIPVRVLRAAQFHEFVGPIVEWGTQGEVTYVPRMRIQPVAARTVAEELAGLATEPEPGGTPFTEVAGPREESLVEMATLLAARRGHPSKIEGVSDPADPDRELNENGAVLPGPGAILAGPHVPGVARLATLTGRSTGPAHSSPRGRRRRGRPALGRRLVRRVVAAARAKAQPLQPLLLLDHLGPRAASLPVVTGSWAPYDHVNVQIGLDT
jgi:hypothetical protein